MELISCFDPFSSERLEKHGGAGRGSVNIRMSSKTCDEFIELLADKVTSAIVREVMSNI